MNKHRYRLVFDNSAGTLRSNAHRLPLDAGQLINRDDRLSHTGDGGLALHADTFHDASGEIATAGAANLRRDLNLNAGWVINNGQTALIAGRDLNLSAVTVAEQELALQRRSGLDDPWQATAKQRTRQRRHPRGRFHPVGDACRTAVNVATQYIAMQDAWEVLNGDVTGSSKNTFEHIYNSLGAEFVSRARWTGLGADGDYSSITFLSGTVITTGLNFRDIYNWRSEAGNALMHAGFTNFKDLYNSRPDPAQWDINQLKNEQSTLQPIHEKYLEDKWWFGPVSKYITNTDKNIFLSEKKGQPGGVDILDYSSRVKYGCKLLGHSEKQGCVP